MVAAQFGDHGGVCAGGYPLGTQIYLAARGLEGHRPGAPPDPFPGFQQDHPVPRGPQLPGGDEARKPRPQHSNVNVLTHTWLPVSGLPG